jgi:hypothetical protein
MSPARLLRSIRAYKTGHILRMSGIPLATDLPGPDLSSTGTEQRVLAQGNGRDQFFRHAGEYIGSLLRI